MRIADFAMTMCMWAQGQFMVREYNSDMRYPFSSEYMKKRKQDILPRLTKVLHLFYPFVSTCRLPISIRDLFLCNMLSHTYAFDAGCSDIGKCLRSH